MHRPLLSLAPLLVPLLGACDRPVDLPADLSWGAPAAAPYAGTPRLVVTNNGDDTLTYLSLGPLAAPQRLGTAPIGQNPLEPQGPHHVAASPDGQFLYVNLSNYVSGGGSGPHGAHGTGQVPGYLAKFDARTNRLVAQVLVDRSPGDVILSRDGRLAFVSHYDLLRFISRDPARSETGYSKIAIVDTATMQLRSLTAVCPTAHGMGLDAAQRLLYITCSLSDELAVLDISDPGAPRLQGRVPMVTGQAPEQPATAQPYALAIHPTDGSVWVSNNLSYDVRVFEPAALAAGARGPQRVVRLGGVAMFAAFSADGATLFVPQQRGPQVPERLSAIDVKSGAVVQDLDVDPGACTAPHVVTRLPDDSGLVLICEGDHQKKAGTALYLQAAPLLVRGSAPLGLFADGVAYLPGTS